VDHLPLTSTPDDNVWRNRSWLPILINTTCLFWSLVYIRSESLCKSGRYKVCGSDWWPSEKQEERIKKECTGIKYQEWKGMVVPYQIWQGIILLFNSLQKKEWKGMRRNYYSLWMVIFFRNVRECIIPRRSLVTIHTLCVSGPPFTSLHHLYNKRLRWFLKMQRGRKISFDPTIIIQRNDHIVGREG